MGTSPARQINISPYRSQDLVEKKLSKEVVNDAIIDDTTANDRRQHLKFNVDTNSSPQVASNHVEKGNSLQVFLLEN